LHSFHPSWDLNDCDQWVGLTTHRWADQAAIEIHKSSSKVAWLEEISKKEDLFDQPLQILTLEQFAGFENR